MTAPAAPRRAPASPGQLRALRRLAPAAGLDDAGLEAQALRLFGEPFAALGAVEALYFCHWLEARRDRLAAGRAGEAA